MKDNPRYYCRQKTRNYKIQYLLGLDNRRINVNIDNRVKYKSI